MQSVFVVLWLHSLGQSTLKQFRVDLSPSRYPQDNKDGFSRICQLFRSFAFASLGSRNRSSPPRTCKDASSILACVLLQLPVTYITPLKFDSWFTSFFFFNFKASFVPTTTFIPVSFVCCCRKSCRRRGGAAALLSIICCCSQIDYEVSTQLGITSSSTHGTRDQLQP